MIIPPRPRKSKGALAPEPGPDGPEGGTGPERQAYLERLDAEERCALGAPRAEFG